MCERSNGLKLSTGAWNPTPVATFDIIVIVHIGPLAFIFNDLRRHAYFLSSPGVTLHHDRYPDSLQLLFLAVSSYVPALRVPCSTPPKLAGAGEAQRIVALFDLFACIDQ